MSHIDIEPGSDHPLPDVDRIGSLEGGCVRTDKLIIKCKGWIGYAIAEWNSGARAEIAAGLYVAQIHEALDLVSQRSVGGETRSLADLVQFRAPGTRCTYCE
jgi:hypothetical protein